MRATAKDQIPAILPRILLSVNEQIRNRQNNSLLKLILPICFLQQHLLKNKAFAKNAVCYLNGTAPCDISQYFRPVFSCPFQ